MTTLGEAAELEFGFNPGQARGFGGKWIKVGEAVKSAEYGKGTVTGTHALGKVSVRFDKGGLKKVNSKDLRPSDHDPLGGEIDEDIIHKRHQDKIAMDDADEEGAHRRDQRRKATEAIEDANPHDRAAERGRQLKKLAKEAANTKSKTRTRRLDDQDRF